MLSAAGFMRSGLAKSTWKMYDFPWSYFTSFCAAYSVAVLPRNISVMCVFIVHCYESCKIQPSSIKGLRSQVYNFICASTNSLLKNLSIHLLLNGFKREKPQGNDIHLPLTVPLLQEWITYLRDGCFCHGGGKTHVESVVCIRPPPTLSILRAPSRSLHCSLSPHWSCNNCSIHSSHFYGQGYGPMVVICLRYKPSLMFKKLWVASDLLDYSINVMAWLLTNNSIAMLLH